MEFGQRSPWGFQQISHSPDRQIGWGTLRWALKFPHGTSLVAQIGVGEKYSFLNRTFIQLLEKYHLWCEQYISNCCSKCWSDFKNYKAMYSETSTAIILCVHLLYSLNYFTPRKSNCIFILYMQSTSEIYWFWCFLHEIYDYSQ